jgi:N-acyl-D-aspartate/D-glutamate deacylase
MLKRCLFFFGLLVFALFAVKACSTGGEAEFDILLTKGKISDGTGSPLVQGDVGIKGDTIVAVGDLARKTAVKTIDATGLIVSPGFIDMHTHCDSGLGELDSNANLNYLIQGATTVVTGNCGGGTFEVAGIKEKWEKQGIGTNAVHMAGFGDIREAVMGREARAPTAEELEKMKSLARKAMEEGAWGMSTGLEYIPDMYSKTEEIIALTKVVAEFGGVYLSHQRDEDANVPEATRETVRIAEEAGVSADVSHFKVCGKKNWGSMKEAVQVINDARASGLNITADMYPYDRASVGPIINIRRNSGWSVFRLPHNMEPFADLREKMRDPNLSNSDMEGLKTQYIEELKKALSDKTKREQIRKSVLEGEPDDISPIKAAGWSTYAIVDAKKNTHLIGKILSDLAEEQGRDAFDIMAELVVDEPDMQQSAGTISEDEMKYAMAEDWLMFSSDGGAASIVKDSDTPVQGHPRSFGSQARVLRKYVREDEVLTLEEAVRKMTSLPASFLQMKDRGLLKEGYKADIVVFDPQTIQDTATYADSRQYCTGTEFVIVNGKVSIENGEYSGALNGKLLLLTENK